MANSPYALNEITFEVGGKHYECAIKSYNLTAETSQVDWEALCPTGMGSVAGRTKYSLAVSGYNDWTPGSFAWFLQEHAGQKAQFTIVDNGIKAAGAITVVPGSLGGEVSSLSEFSVTFPLDGKPTLTADPASAPSVGIKGAVQAGDRFYEATVTASDSTNAGKLAGLGYVATGAKWAAGKSFTVSGFAFHWSGTAFAAGAAS